MKITWCWENWRWKRKVRAIPALLDLIDVSGDTITIDAMGCRKEIVKKADYVLAVKENQPILYEESRDYFAYLDEEKTGDLAEDVWESGIEKGHGRMSGGGYGRPRIRGF